MRRQRFLAGSRAGLPVVSMVLIVLYGYLFCLLQIAGGHISLAVPAQAILPAAGATGRMKHARSLKNSGGPAGKD